VGQVDYASTLENLVREIDRAGLALMDEIEALAGEVVQKTLGALDVREARIAAVNAVVREHSLDTPIEVHVPPEDSTLVTQVFSTDDQGVTNRYLVRVDPILRPGEIVVISPLGRIKAGPSARAAEVARFVRTSR
jgi:flagellar biosynthesis/type III secretory pathway protein FliH